MKHREIPEVLEKAEVLQKLMYQAEYKRALQISKKLYRKYPKNAYATFLYAVHLGDSVVSGFDLKAEKVKMMAAKMLKPLLKRLREIPIEKRMTLRNEFYWFSNQAKKQYRLGLQEIQRGQKIGYYSMGVGGWCIAREYALKGKRAYANRWAEKSIRAWERYFMFNSQYYNSWSWYARPLGFIGRKADMMKALKIATQLSGKSIHFPEFQEVLLENMKLKERKVIL